MVDIIIEKEEYDRLVEVDKQIDFHIGQVQKEEKFFIRVVLPIMTLCIGFLFGMGLTILALQ